MCRLSIDNRLQAHNSKYYCLEHRDPKAHDCPSTKKPGETEARPTSTVNTAVKSRDKNKEKKKLLTIHFTFLEDKKRSGKEHKSVHNEILGPQPLSKMNEKEGVTLEAGDIRVEDSARTHFTGKLRPPTIIEETARATSYPAVFESVSRRLFAVSFILVLVEEVLRLVSYVENPPFLAYLDGNLYVRVLNESIDPYVASLIVFVLMCSILFMTAKLASMNQSASNSHFSVLRHAIPFGVYVAVSLTYIVSMINWFFILRS